MSNKLTILDIMNAYVDGAVQTHLGIHVPSISNNEQQLRTISTEADRWATERARAAFPTAEPHTPANTQRLGLSNALAHGYASASLTANFDAESALEASQERETQTASAEMVDGTFQDHLQDHLVDTYNNAVGRMIGAYAKERGFTSDADIKALTSQAVGDGDLITSEQDPRIVGAGNVFLKSYTIPQVTKFDTWVRDHLNPTYHAPKPNVTGTSALDGAQHYNDDLDNPTLAGNPHNNREPTNVNPSHFDEGHHGLTSSQSNYNASVSYDSPNGSDDVHQSGSSHTQASPSANSSFDEGHNGLTSSSGDHSQNSGDSGVDNHDHPGKDGTPVILDLDGNGVSITPETQSNKFFDTAGDGLQHRTAWAGVGDAVLAYDADDDGVIDQQNEIVFTQWDPTATDDLQALRNAFDTDHDGKLDSGDDKFSSFKLMVTNADGTTTTESLTTAGIASIDLLPDATKVVLPDGSEIDGETTFTRTDSTTGTAAAVSLASDANGYAIAPASGVTHNGDGSTTIVNTALSGDGHVANSTTTLTSADGLSRTTTFDDNGDGVIDRTQEDDTAVDGAGIKTEILTETSKAVLVDRTTTVTSADGKSIAIGRDQKGGGYLTQTETRITDGGGVNTITVTDLNPDQSTKDTHTTTLSADKLTRTEGYDIDGDGKDDLIQTDTISTLDPTATRTEAVTEKNQDASERDQTIICHNRDGIYPPINGNALGMPLGRARVLGLFHNRRGWGDIRCAA